MFLTARRPAHRRRHLLAARGRKIDGENGPRLQDDPQDSSATPTRTSRRTSRSRPTSSPQRRPRRLDDAGARHRHRRPGPQAARRRSSTALKEEFDPEYGGFGNPQPQVPRPEVPDAAAPRVPAAARPSATKDDEADRTWSRSRSTTWPWAASTTSSAAASIATAPNAPGPCRTSRRCSTTTPSSSRSTPRPIALTKKPLYRRIVAGDAGLRRARDDVAGGGVLFLAGRRDAPRGGPLLRLDRQGAGRRAAGQGGASSWSARSTAPTGQPNFEKKYHILTLPQAARRGGRRT